jgi:hypothetical protein
MGGIENKTKRFSEEEKNTLEKEFQKNPHPTDFLITKYARLFKVEERKIRSWFYRRQYKQNKELRETKRKELEKMIVEDDDEDIYEPPSSSDEETDSSENTDSSSNSSSEEEEEEEINVSQEKHNYENLLRKRFIGNRIEYLVKWENYSELT